jgi:ribonuclease VapC
MVLDSSAVLAILFNEPERDAFATAVAEAGQRLISTVNAFEAGIVVSARKGPAGGRELDLLLHHAGIVLVPFNEDQLRLAREAWERYGRGRHPAGLNLGDCCAYALSRHSGEPLLFKGADFARTDVARAAGQASG